jgi:hypothetical protein
MLIAQFGFVQAQELLCQVSVNSQQVEGSDKRRFETLQNAITEFMNNRQWTNRRFSPNEKIECTLYITFDKNTSGENYKGSIQLQSRRPVFNSSYNSPVLNLKDDQFGFTYVEYDPLNFDINTFTDNLTSVLAYYAYLVIGYDFETMAPLGGNEYFNNCQTIVNNAQNSAFSGWKMMDKDVNRYWMVENLLNSKYSDYRTFLYKYHRLGLDQMQDNISKGKQEVLEAMKLLEKVNRAKPNLPIIRNLMDAKRDEFIGIFSGAQANEQNMAKSILLQLDPVNAGKYQAMTVGTGK